MIYQDSMKLARRFYKDVIPRIGLEVHAQLDINSKLFSQGGSSNQAPPNSQLDLFDISMPGSLPKVNRSALHAAVLTSLGLNCAVQDIISFDRKNYFYMDMPAGFQITQYNNPIAKDGYIEFIVNSYHKSVIAHSQQYDVVKYLYFEDRRKAEELESYIKRSRIKQIQLEQDSAKTLHQDEQQESCTLVDYNRSGSGLVEIVFEPDLENHHEASSLVKELIFVLKALGTCDCELQEGSLRVDANVSIQSIQGQNVDNSARVELKNLNSLKSLNKGILHEVLRQAELISNGSKVIQETRTYDTKSNRTVPLRIKEESVDYRYVPEPNIPPIRLSEESIVKAKQEIPKSLPADIRKDLIENYNLDLNLVTEIIDEPRLNGYFEKIMKSKPDYNANAIADFLIYCISNLRHIVGPEIQVDFSEGSKFMERLSPKSVQIVIDLMLKGNISAAIAYETIKYIFISSDQTNPEEIIERFSWQQINDSGRVEEICRDCIIKMKNISKNYVKKGHKRYLRMMVLKVCELTDNKINVKMAIDSFNQQLKPPESVTE